MAATRPSGAPCGPQDTGDGSEAGPEGDRPPQGDTVPHIPAHQQAGYDAVWEIVRRFPCSAERNAVVWRAVEAYRLASEREHERQVRKQAAAEVRALADQFGSANSLAMGAEAETLRWAADRIDRPEGT